MRLIVLETVVLNSSDFSFCYKSTKTFFYRSSLIDCDCPSSGETTTMAPPSQPPHALLLLPILFHLLLPLIPLVLVVVVDASRGAPPPPPRRPRRAASFAFVVPSSPTTIIGGTRGAGKGRVSISTSTTLPSYMPPSSPAGGGSNDDRPPPRRRLEKASCPFFVVPCLFFCRGAMVFTFHSPPLAFSPTPQSIFLTLPHSSPSLCPLSLCTFGAPCLPNLFENS